MLNGFTKRSIEVMCITTSTSWRASATIKEQSFQSMLARNSCQVFFRPEDRPIRPQITSIFCAIRKSKHDSLVVLPFAYVSSVSWNGIQLFHDARGMRKIFDGFKQRNYVKLQLVSCTNQQPRKRKNLNNVKRTLAMTDNVSMAPHCAIFFLDRCNGMNTLNGFAYESVIEFLLP